MPIAVQDLVNREVHYCVSALVATVAQGYGHFETAYYSAKGGPLRDCDLGEIFEQAFELSRPIEDWKEAAIEAVAAWDRDRLQDEGFKLGLGDAPATMSESHMRADVVNALYKDDDFEEFCAQNDIEPYQREIYEHWIVSEWLADRLAEKGEKVDKDFAGMVVWARTTTGQGIASDSVIEQIHAELLV